MGYLEVDKTAEALWIYWYSVDDLYAWAEANGLPRGICMIQSGSITVEQTDGGLLLYLEAVPLKDGEPIYDFEKAEFMVRSVILPYVEPIPEGIGKLIDWDYGLPEKKSPRPQMDEEFYDV